MIGKKISNPKKSSGKALRIKRLITYVVAPQNDDTHEKCIASGSANFFTRTNGAQILEMTALALEAVKSLDPIDHWVFSWKKEERPTKLQAYDAVMIFITHIKFLSHQYIYGLHDDTKNMHIHIVINRVDPANFKVMQINDGFDREAAQQAIAMIENMQGWSCQKNARYVIEDGKLKKLSVEHNSVAKVSARALSMELTTGEISAERIAINIAAPLIKKANNWQELHEELFKCGFSYVANKRGAKVFVLDIPIKARSCDPSSSLKKLELRFGPFEIRYPGVDLGIGIEKIKSYRDQYRKIPHWINKRENNKKIEISSSNLSTFHEDKCSEHQEDSQAVETKRESINSLERGHDEASLLSLKVVDYFVSHKKSDPSPPCQITESDESSEIGKINEFQNEIKGVEKINSGTTGRTDLSELDRQQARFDSVQLNFFEADDAGKSEIMDWVFSHEAVFKSSVSGANADRHSLGAKEKQLDDINDVKPDRSHNDDFSP